MSTDSRSALRDGGKAVAISVALGVVIAFMPLFSIAAIPAMPIPVAFITSRHGIGAGFLVSLLTGAACMALTAPLIGFAAGTLIFLLAAIAGLGGGLAMRKEVTQYRLFISTAAVFFAALLLWLAALLLISGQGPVSAVESLADATAEPSRQIYQAMGFNEKDVEEAIAQAREFALLLPYLAPAVLLVVSLVLSGVNLAFGRRVFARLRQPFPRDFVFRDYRVHWLFAYAMIIALLCEFLSPYAPEAYTSAIELVGANLFIISEVLFFIQGMAIANFFLWVYKVARVKRLAVYSCLILLQLTLSLTSWMGLFDTWIDYRRRFIRKNLSGQKG